MFRVAATANGVTYTSSIPTGSQGSGSGSSSGGVSSDGRPSSGFGMITMFSIGCVTLGACSVFI